MKATYYCNWFNGTYSRHPRTRYGKVHMLNNLYTNITAYGVGVTCAAQVMLEGNYFENTKIPTLISRVNDPDETLSGDPEGFLKAVSNFSVNSGTIVENLSEYDFYPHDYYEYTVIDSQEVKEIVQSTAGAGNLDIGTSIEDKKSVFPVNFLLNQNCPNPFNPLTRINYTIPENGVVHLEVFNILGEKVQTLVNEYKNSGKYSVNFDANDLSSGIYFYRLVSGKITITKKMILTQ